MDHLILLGEPLSHRPSIVFIVLVETCINSSRWPYTMVALDDEFGISLELRTGRLIDICRPAI